MVTTEVRYFFRGKLNSDWMAAIHHFNMEPQNTRIDHYLRNEASTLFGVKWREGNLEVKGLVDSMTNEGVHMETWEKNTISSNATMEKADNWISVTKKRWLQLFNKNLQLLSQLPEGEKLYCQMEVSNIEVMGEAYYSFCLECGGGSSESRVRLLSSCLQMFTDELPQLAGILYAQKPCSYPLFLNNPTNCT